MTLIVVNHERETVHLPVRLRAAYPVDVRMVQQSQATDPDSWTTKKGVAAIRGVKVNDLSPLWPAGHFRAEIIRAAEMWLPAMKTQGYELETQEGDVMVWGPWKAKDWARAGDKDGWHGAGDELTAQQTDTLDFLLYANFVATHGYAAMAEHELLAASAGSLYDEMMKKTHNNVLEAAALLPREALPPSRAGVLAADLVEERERRAVRDAGLSWR